MSNFTRQTKIVPLPGGDTVTLRKLDFGRRQAVTDAAAEFDSEMNVKPLGGRARKEILYQSILDWDGPGFEGLPPSRENIDMLDPELGELLLSEVDKFSEPLTDAEKKA